MQRIAVIDYGMGNLRSVAKAIEAVSDDADVIVTSDADIISQSDRIVCPGQGAARDCMAALLAANLGDIICQGIKEKPFLGICMGLQVLLSRSDENGGVNCLNILPGHVRRFGDSPCAPDTADTTAAPDNPTSTRLKVPHMGWSQVDQTDQHVLWDGIDNHSRFYFAHSYYVVPNDISTIVAHCTYGERFAVTLATDNVFACQFHPEKSAEAGLRLLKNFTRWDGAARRAES